MGIQATNPSHYQYTDSGLITRLPFFFGWILQNPLEFADWDWKQRETNCTGWQTVKNVMDTRCRLYAPLWSTSFAMYIWYQHTGRRWFLSLQDVSHSGGQRNTGYQILSLSLETKASSPGPCRARPTYVGPFLHSHWGPFLHSVTAHTNMISSVHGNPCMNGPLYTPLTLSASVF